jgi:hypothetical protein
MGLYIDAVQELNLVVLLSNYGPLQFVFQMMDFGNAD